jgi:hypothetical protein
LEKLIDFGFNDVGGLPARFWLWQFGISCGNGLLTLGKLPGDVGDKLLELALSEFSGR